MTHSVEPEPDPRITFEALEEKLRALPPVVVPAGLSSKLVAGIQVGKAPASPGTTVASNWLFFGAVSVICIALATGAYLAMNGWFSEATKITNQGGNPTNPSNSKPAADLSSKALNAYQQAVQVDPFNADAWFALAKAQAAAQRSEDAIASAHKAIDVARSRNRLDLASSAESWLRSYRAAQTKQSTK